MKQRTISAVIFAAVMLGGVFGGPMPFLLLVILLTSGALWEFGGLVFRQENNYLSTRRILLAILGLTPLCLTVCAQSGIPVTAVFPGVPQETALLVIITLYVFSALIGELFLQSNRPFHNAGLYALGLIYVGVPFALLLSIAQEDGTYMPMRVFGMLLLTWTNDSLAYMIGSRIGKRPFFLRISPKKTWEGTLGGIVCTFIIAGILAWASPAFTPVQWIALAGVTAVFGTLGDLVESLLKRSLQIKDSGAILPGHGGFLDRFDSFIFMLPFAWLVLRLLGA